MAEEIILTQQTNKSKAFKELKEREASIYLESSQEDSRESLTLEVTEASEEQGEASVPSLSTGQDPQALEEEVIVQTMPIVELEEGVLYQL